MILKPFDWISFESIPIIGIVRNLSKEKLSELLPHYIEAKFSTIEITMNTPNALQMIKDASTNYRDHLNIGAGTVCSLKDLEIALAAGANFIVTPVVVKDVIKACAKMKIPVFAGAFSPTEIFDAWSLGASMIKVFPASSLGPDFIKSIKAPFPQIKIMPTGGIDSEAMFKYKESGADGFGIGSPLFSSEIIKNSDWEGFKKHLKVFKSTWEH